MNNKDIRIKGYILKAIIEKLEYESGLTEKDLSSEDLQEIVNDFLDKALFETI
jgi:hypothetical protein